MAGPSGVADLGLRRTVRAIMLGNSPPGGQRTHAVAAPGAMEPPMVRLEIGFSHEDGAAQACPRPSASRHASRPCHPPEAHAPTFVVTRCCPAAGARLSNAAWLVELVPPGCQLGLHRDSAR